MPTIFSVNKKGDSIRFLRKIVNGGVDESYGIDVAKLAGLPNKVISRAREILSQMEEKNHHKKSVSESSQQTFEFQSRENALKMLEKTNIDELSDSECRELLKDMINIIK